MHSMEDVKRMVSGMDVKCPECGKRPEKLSYTSLDGGLAKAELACCHGSGFVMVHAATGQVVDARYKSTAKAAAAPAYIPLVFSAAGGNGATVRVTGWLQEKLPASGAGRCCGAAKGGFWAKVKQCLAGLWT